MGKISVHGGPTAAESYPDKPEPYVVTEGVSQSEPLDEETATAAERLEAERDDETDETVAPPSIPAPDDKTKAATARNKNIK